MASCRDFVLLKQAVHVEHCALRTYKTEMQYT